KLHREDGPAIERVGGDKDWFINGKRHREDGPAVEYADGTKHWYINGKSHREDGPAIEWSDGEKQWYKSDKLHREDGPAIEYANGNKYWYINGKGLTEEEFNLQMKPKPIRTEYADRVEWRLDGKLHREDGPALEFANGTKSWYINGKSLTKKEFKLRTKQKKRKEKRASMNTEDIKKVLKTSAKDVGKSIASGMKLEAIERTNDNVYDGICQLLVSQLGVDKSKLDSPIMKEAILTLVPLFLHPVAVAMDGKVAYAKWAKDYAETSIELSAKRNSGAMMDSLSAMFKLLHDANQPVTSSRFTFSTDYAALAKNKLRILAKEKNLRVATSQSKEDLVDLLEQTELEEAGLLIAE
ncbi:MAG: hypothetical protein Q8O87_02405, partial [bacterium]|nr:hypothetical protein [bacterium]